jgi:hypothetical protein
MHSNRPHATGAAADITGICMNQKLILGAALAGLAAFATPPDAFAAAPGRAAVTAARPDVDVRTAAAADAAYAPGTRSTRTPVANVPTHLRGVVRPLAVNEGFEGVEKILETGSALGGGIYANGWIRRNNSDAPNLTWYKGSTGTFAAYDGAPDSYLAQNWFATLSNTGTASVWALTPPVNFGAGASVSFWTRTVENAPQPDRLQVRVCATGDCTDVGTLPEDVGNFATLVADINAGETVGGYPEQWTRYVLTQADGLPTSGSGRIAFRYYFHQDAGTLAGSYIGIDRVEIDEGDAAANGIDLAVTVAPADPAAPDACGTATSIDVATGDQVNVCYRVTNTSAAPLGWHWLRDDIAGPVFANREQPLAPGATWQFNRTITVAASQSPSYSWIAQRDRQGYTPDDTQPAQYIDATDGTELDPQTVWGGATVPFPSDFRFTLYGERIDALCVMGYAVVGNKRNEFCPTYTAGLPALPDGNLTGVFGSAMGLFQTYVAYGGRYFTKVLGTAPLRRYVIEYNDNPVAFGSTDPGRGLSAQIVLNETTNVIEFQYRNLVFGGHPIVAYGGRASIGLQGQQIGQQYSYMTPSLRTVRRIAWRPADPTVYARTRQIHITAHAPVLSVDTPSIAASAPSHGTTSATLAIANDGDGRLDWATGVDTNATSHFPATPRVLARRHSGAFDPLASAAPRSAGNARSTQVQGNGAGLPLWMFDIGNGYLLQTTRDTPGYGTGAGVIRGYPRERLVTGADFIDDDFTQLYAYDTASHALLRYDPISSTPNVYANATVVGIAALPTGEFGHGLKQDPTTGAVYLVTTTGQASRLWTIDIGSASVREVGEIEGMPGVLAIAFDASGRLYGVDGIYDALIAIDKTTGNAQAIGELGFATGANVSALAFDPTDGALYFAGFDGITANLFHVDTITGSATYVAMLTGPEGTGAQLGAMTFAHRTSRCTQPADVPWLVPALTGGSIAPGAAPAPLALGFNAASLADGVYTANLCIHSNDPLRRRHALPVTFTVGSGDAIFTDGFEGE